MNAPGVECVLARWTVMIASVLVGLAPTAGAAVAAEDGGAVAGWNLLLARDYLPPDFDQEVFDDLWTTWPEPLRVRAERATPAERRLMAMERYGLTPHPDDPSRSLQYVVGSDGRWTMSCLACHQGQVAGCAIPGLPNSNYALETLTEEVRLVKVRPSEPRANVWWR